MQHELRLGSASAGCLEPGPALNWMTYIMHACCCGFSTVPCCCSFECLATPSSCCQRFQQVPPLGTGPVCACCGSRNDVQHDHISTPSFSATERWLYAVLTPPAPGLAAMCLLSAAATFLSSSLFS